MNLVQGKLYSTEKHDFNSGNPKNWPVKYIRDLTEDEHKKMNNLYTCKGIKLFETIPNYVFSVVYSDVGEQGFAHDLGFSKGHKIVAKECLVPYE